MKIKFTRLIVLPCSILLVIVSSCRRDDVNIKEESKQTTTISDLPKYPRTSVNVQSDFWDINDQDKQSPLIFIKDSVWNGGRSSIFENDEIIVSPGLEKFVYLGSMLQGGSIETMRYTPIVKPTVPITISFSFPADYVVAEIERPSLSAMRQAIRTVMIENSVNGTQISSLSYEINQFSYFEEIKLAFTSNVDIAKILGVGVEFSSGKIRKKTGLYCKFIQRNFTVDMDIPWDGLLKNSNDLSGLGQYSPVYVSSVTYGRSAIMTLESDHSFDSLRMAVNVALKAEIINGKINIEGNFRKILDESKMHLYFIGGNSVDVVESVKGFVEFQQYIIDGGQYSPDVPGVPVSFTLSHLADHSPFYTRFCVSKPN